MKESMEVNGYNYIVFHLMLYYVQIIYIVIYFNLQ